ncbi:MAG: hypothetical protein WCS37_08120 [Chloroflexota bacterium]
MQNPWSALPLEVGKPFVLESDREEVEKLNAKASEIHKLRLDAFPGPFMGRIDAPILLLTLNPGFVENEVVQNINDRRWNIKCLHHEEQDYPFFLLDPEISGSEGYKWWYKRLRTLIERYDARFLANNLLHIEFFPYPSVGAAGFHRKRVLPSQEYGFHLVREAMERKAAIITMRSLNSWFTAIPKLESYKRCYILRNALSAYITEGNCPAGYAEIVKVLDKRYLDYQASHS